MYIHTYTGIYLLLVRTHGLDFKKSMMDTMLCNQSLKLIHLAQYKLYCTL